jgi:hypothetical protein
MVFQTFEDRYWLKRHVITFRRDDYGVGMQNEYAGLRCGHDECAEEDVQVKVIIVGNSSEHCHRYWMQSGSALILPSQLYYK